MINTFYTGFSLKNLINSKYNSERIEGSSNKEISDLLKKEAQDILKQLKDNPDYNLGAKSDEIKADIKKISQMLNDGGLTEYGAIDMLSKVLKGISIEKQYEDAFKTNNGIQNSIQYRNIIESKPEVPTFI